MQPQTIVSMGNYPVLSFDVPLFLGLGLLDVETHHPLPVSPCGHHWEDDMEDDLLKLLIDKARCFEATIRYVIKGR